MLTFTAEMSLACTYSLRRPLLARDCAVKAFFAALTLGRPDLMWAANNFIAALGVS